MTDKREPVTEVDELLRRACADDLPDDVAAVLRRRIDAFKAGTAVEGRRAPAKVFFLPRVAWAALSILMLLAGVLLQGSKAANPLADRISSIKMAYAALDTTRR